MDYMVAAYSDIGIKKSTNQDSVLIKVAETDYGKVMLVVVCDGMGGLAKGEVASATLIRAFDKWFIEQLPVMLNRGFNANELKSCWEIIVIETNYALSEFGKAHDTKLGTTVVALLVVNDKYYIVNVGDSRAYMLTDQVNLLTKDQTYVQREMDAGRMTYEESLRDSKRSVLLQCVGASDYIEVEFLEGQVEPGMVFMLCSDGFRHVITETEIFGQMSPQVIRSEQDMLNAEKFLVEMNKTRREQDNISVAMIKVVQEGEAC